MNSSPAAARFVAFVCFLNSGERSPQEAGLLARKNWKRFVPYASDEVVRLVTPKNNKKRRPQTRRTTRKLAAAC